MAPGCPYQEDFRWAHDLRTAAARWRTRQCTGPLGIMRRIEPRLALVRPTAASVRQQSTAAKTTRGANRRSSQTGWFENPGQGIGFARLLGIAWVPLTFMAALSRPYSDMSHS